MMPHIENTRFGSITIEGREYPHDIVIRLNGEIKKRKKKLSKSVYGTSHTVSRDEAAHILDDGAKMLVIGTGQQGVLDFSEEAKAYITNHGCSLILKSTPTAVKYWNRSASKAIAMFHVTC